jgi:FolB domain-containing protein
MVVFIDRLRISGPIGWYELERNEGVELFVSVSIDYNLSSLKDDLSETIDYLGIADEILNLVKTEYKLLETLSIDIANNLFLKYSDFAIKSIKIKIEKRLQHKIGIQLDYVGVEQTFNYPF